MPNCRTPECRRYFRWATTDAGHPLPLDPDPTPDGTFVFVDGRAHKLTPAEQAEPLRPGERRYTTHFATCPGSKAWSGSHR